MHQQSVCFKHSLIFLSATKSSKSKRKSDRKEEEEADAAEGAEAVSLSKLSLILFDEVSTVVVLICFP